MSNVKIITFVPVDAADAVRQAMSAAGAGRQGNYDSTSFSSIGTGRFRPLDGAHPAIGSVGTLELVEEERIETLCDRGLAKQVIAAMKQVHPYEEVAFDIIPLLEEAES